LKNKKIVISAQSLDQFHCFTSLLKCPEFKNRRKVQYLVHEKLYTCTWYFLKLLSIYHSCARHLSDRKMWQNGCLLCAWSASGNIM